MYGCSLAILDHPEHDKISPVAKSATTDNIPYADYVHDELRDAEKYWNDYLRTKKEKFKHISRRELSHAAALIEEIEDKGIVAELSARLRNMEKSIK